jgi:endonuclease YncB( thermonuclease family)
MLGFIAAAAVLLSLFPPASSSAGNYFFGLGHAKDGDSLMVGDREVRLFGIDSPEWDQTCKRGGLNWACGQDAAEELSKLVTGREVSCVAVNSDEYGRTVAQCTANGVDVNRTMVESGYATAYRHYSTVYVSAEQSAKANRRGIWAGTFELPSQYRHEESGGPVQVRRGGGQVAKVTKQSSQPSGDCVIKGNRGPNGWIYHLPGMPYYNQTHAEEMFCSEEQAQAAGYRRARVQ